MLSRGGARRPRGRCEIPCRHCDKRRKRSAGSAARPLASKSVTTIVGFTEAGGTEKLYNAAAVFHDGRVVGVYRKRYPAIRTSVYSAGNRSPIFTVASLSFGIICNDSNYPELAADMVARGA